MNRTRQPNLNTAQPGQGSRQAPIAWSLGQRVGDMPAVDGDQAFIQAIDESNQLPIPNDLIVSVHIPNETQGGCAPQKWSTPLIDQIKRLSTYFDRDRRVCELHIHLDQTRPITTLIQHLVHQVETHFSLAENATLSFFSPIGMNAHEMLAEKTAFQNIHLDYFFKTASDLEKNLFHWKSQHAKNTTMGLTLHGHLGQRLTHASIKEWLAKISENNPDRVTLESLQADASGYQNLLYTQSDAARVIRQLQEAGYHAIGGGTFAKPTCQLAKAKQSGQLGLGLDSYLTGPNLDQVGLGPGALSQVGEYVAKNHTDPVLYAHLVARGRLPVAHGLMLQHKDMVTQAIVNDLVCQHRLSIDLVQRRFMMCFRRYLPKEYEALEKGVEAGLLTRFADDLEVTDLGLANLVSIVSPFTESISLPNSTYQSVVRIS